MGKTFYIQKKNLTLKFPGLHWGAKPRFLGRISKSLLATWCQLAVYEKMNGDMWTDWWGEAQNGIKNKLSQVSTGVWAQGAHAGPHCPISLISTSWGRTLIFLESFPLEQGKGHGRRQQVLGCFSAQSSESLEREASLRAISALCVWEGWTTDYDNNLRAN